jgi:subtilisin family serine protease
VTTKLCGLCLGVAVLVAVCAAPAGAAAPRPAAARVVVGYRTPAALNGLHVLRTVPALRIAEVRGEPGRLRNRKGIRFVHRVVARTGEAEPAVAMAPNVAALEWQFAAVHEDVVPDWVLHAASAITIAVIDTGADLSAPDLAEKTPAAYNVHTGSANVHDAIGHGTFVASLAAGSVENGDGIGISGFGGDAKLIVVKASGADGSFTDVDEANAIVYAVDHGARIVNLSLGGRSTSQTERDAIAYASTHGALIIAAAGNEGKTNAAPEYPAALLQPPGSNGSGGAGLAVAASTENGARARFSNSGSYISLAAPGENVFGAVSAFASPSLYPRVPLPGSLGGAYGFASGTSFATPEVAGAAALVWAANPLLTAAQVADVLKQTASGSGAWNPDLGFGVIDVAAAVTNASGRPALELRGTRRARRLRLTWRVQGTATAFRLDVRRDGGATRVALGPTTETASTITLAPGHTYAFTVDALDDGGAVTGSSAPYRLSVPARYPSTRSTTAPRARKRSSIRS